MDKERIDYCRKVSMMASSAGCVASLEEFNGNTRMASRSTEGHTVSGEFMPTKEESFESWTKAFITFLKNDTSPGKRNS